MTVIDYSLQCTICKALIAGQIIKDGKRDNFYTVYRDFFFVNGEHVCKPCVDQITRLTNPTRNMGEKIPLIKECNN